MPDNYETIDLILIVYRNNMDILFNFKSYHLKSFPQSVEIMNGNFISRTLTANFLESA